MEGAAFSLRFAAIFKKLGGRQASFLIHTLRNYKTKDRMTAIFDAVKEIGKKFIETADERDIHLRYFGHEVHSSYALADLINAAEMVTKGNKFKLNFLTNYSEIWAVENMGAIKELPEVSVIGRFTKGHYSGAGIPGKASKANFCYIQQASVNENWTDQQMIVLILGLLKSHVALNGFVGGKSYKLGEKEDIYNSREEELWEGNYSVKTGSKRPKRMTTFTPVGPVTIKY
ncbi:MAG: hypothetical protein GPJ54_01665 [Candidatus Heimdallarchaeota archaeon]|nr:hypothetical protein [Candidatus Heimdallarchaeota archaeon]